MIGKILHFRAAAREHGLRDVVQRRERGHVVLLPALCAQHAALAHPVARPVAQVFVSCRTAFGRAAQHGEIELVERLRGRGRAVTGRPAQLEARFFTDERFGQQRAP